MTHLTLVTWPRRALIFAVSLVLSGVQVCSLVRSSHWRHGIPQSRPPPAHLQNFIIACCVSSSEELEMCLFLVNNCIKFPTPVGNLQGEAQMCPM